MSDDMKRLVAAEEALEQMQDALHALPGKSKKSIETTLHIVIVRALLLKVAKLVAEGVSMEEAAQQAAAA